MARVLVTDAQLGSAISVIRALGRRGHRVIAASSDPRSPGFYSRYATDRVTYPPPDREPEGMIEALLDVVRSHDVDLVVPVTDAVIVPMSERREGFESHAKLALPGRSALGVARDKLATLELARQVGVPVPESALVNTALEARRKAAEVGWPVVLKPQASLVSAVTGSVAVKVGYSGGFATLERHMRPLEGLCPVLLQRYHPGEAMGVELLAHEGRPLAAFQHRRLREVPITGGASSFRESVPLDPTLYAHAKALIEAMRWTGLAMVEFKVADEGPLLMEVNGRIWGSLPLAVKSGMDFPGLMVDMFLTGPSPPEAAPVTAYEIGVRSRNVDLDVVWIASVLRKKRRYPFLPTPRRREALAAALRLPWPGDGYDTLASDDPVPGVAELGRICGKLVQKAAATR
jgi:predicted ATP-grasp superfamily ATP-dependent carboligase